MSKSINDYAQVEISNKVKDILRMYHISTWHSDPYYQNQNPSELTEFRQPLQVQSHLEMPRVLVQLGHIQRT